MYYHILNKVNHIIGPYMYHTIILIEICDTTTFLVNPNFPPMGRICTLKVCIKKNSQGIIIERFDEVKNFWQTEQQYLKFIETQDQNMNFWEIFYIRQSPKTMA